MRWNTLDAAFALGNWKRTFEGIAMRYDGSPFMVERERSRLAWLRCGIACDFLDGLKYGDVTPEAVLEQCKAWADAVSEEGVS